MYYQSLIYIFSFLFGLAIGSFLNVVVLRYPQFVSIAKTRSHCPKCLKILKWYDLVPFFSFVLLSGKCRFCKVKISWQYPLVEVITGIITLAVFYFFGFTWQAAFILLLSYLLIVVSVFDCLSMEIPDFFLWLCFGSSILYLLAGLVGLFPINFTNSLIGLAIFAGFPLIIHLITRGKGMGIGDFKIGLALGLVAGYPQSIVSLFFGILLGSLFGILLIILKKKNLKSPVPFVPFLALGFFIALFWGPYLWHLYFSVW